MRTTKLSQVAGAGAGLAVGAAVIVPVATPAQVALTVAATVPVGVVLLVAGWVRDARTGGVNLLAGDGVKPPRLHVAADVAQLPTSDSHADSSAVKS